MNDKRYPGVNYNKQADLWVARVYDNGKTYGMGCYNDRDEAVQARQLGEATLTFKRYDTGDIAH